MHHWIALHGPRPAPPRQQWRAGAASAQASSGQFSGYLSALVTFRSLDSTAYAVLIEEYRTKTGRGTRRCICVLLLFQKHPRAGRKSSSLRCVYGASRHGVCPAGRWLVGSRVVRGGEDFLDLGNSIVRLRVILASSLLLLSAPFSRP